MMDEEPSRRAAEAGSSRRPTRKGRPCAHPGPRGRLAASLATLAVLIAAAVGCQSGGGETAPSPSRSTPSTTSSGPRAHVLAVKIDNVGPARPQTGLDKADIVYVEQVEAGLSRILAAYSSRMPPVVGPVRSARETDLELLRQFDRPTLAFSGAQAKLLPAIEAAPLNPLPPTADPGAYFRGSDRAAPHNLYLRPGKTPHATTGVNAAEDIGLRFAAPPPGGRPSPDTRSGIRRPASPSPGPPTGTGGWWTWTAHRPVRPTEPGSGRPM